MFYSKTCEYAIRVLACLVERDTDEFVCVADISKESGVSAPYVAKVCQMLVKNGFLDSRTGPNGGFMLGDNVRSCALMDIVNAVDNSSQFTQCVMGLEECSEKHACPLHFTWKKYKSKMLETLEKSTLKDIAPKVKQFKFRSFERSKLKDCA